MKSADTIVALATPPSPAMRAIVRVSGAGAIDCVAALTTAPEVLAAGAAFARSVHVSLRLVEPANDAGFDVPAMAWCFSKPNSATGEDVVELHMPGSPFFVQRLLTLLQRQGVRQARPGEFTARAFFNGKLSLDAAEGVAAAISASNRFELDAARRLLSGELARRLAPVMEQIAQTLALVEVDLDFSEEDITFISREQVHSSIDSADHDLCQLLRQSTRFERLVHQPQIVLVGRPNAGKSTLLNALAGTERAVVSDTAGTTRDALHATVPLFRGMVRLIDVAGLDSEGEDTHTDPDILRQMRESAERSIMAADLVAMCIDSTDARNPLTLRRDADLSVWTKADLCPEPPAHAVSAVTGAGLNDLKRRLDALAFPATPAEHTSPLALNSRHVDAIHRARNALAEAKAAISGGPELAAVGLRFALDALGSILGTVSPDDVLGRIFSSFCIGK